MASTIKSILDRFCKRINQPLESAYATATTPAAYQYVELFNKVAADLLDINDSWAQLKRIYTFTVTTGVSNYQLPGDYLSLLPGTQWGVTNQIPLAGPISNAQLAFQTYGVNIATPFPTYQVNGAQGYIFNTSPYTQRSQGYFQISPAGQNSTDINAIAYTSSNYVWPTDWLATHAYVVGNIVTGINNMYYCTVSGTSSTTRLSATSGTIVDGTASWVPYSEPYPITADTDIFLLDDELMIEGLRGAWYESKQQFDMADRIQRGWRLSVSAAIGRLNGAITLNAGENTYGNLQWPVVPQTGWGTGDV